MRKLFGYFHEPHHRVGVRCLQVALGSMVLFRILTELPFYGYLWGPHGISDYSMKPLLGQRLGTLADLPFSTEAGTIALLLIAGLGCLGLILGRLTTVSTLIVLTGFQMMQNRLPMLGDGGDNVTQIVLFYMLFALPPKSQAQPGSLRVWVHNIAVLAIILQTIMLYATSGCYKMFGDRWQHGVAMYYVSQVEWFSTPAAREWFKSPLMATLGTYVPMMYQVVFPIAIISRIKIPWLVIGMFFHIGTAAIMGLVTFAVVMIGLELALITDEEYEALKSRIGQKWAQLQAWWEDVGPKIRDRALRRGILPRARAS